MWKRPVDELDKARAIMNVATGASITSAARAELLHGIARAERPIYCDTDSLVCRDLDMPDGAELGAWKHEGDATEAAIAGRKLYALWGEESADPVEAASRVKAWGDPRCIKLASKGVRLQAGSIREVAMGKVIRWKAEAPTFNVAGGHFYLERDVRMTA